MKLSQQIIDLILSADAKALATYSSGEINVVPVSAVRIIEDNIWLMNFFMGKTIRNIEKNSKASLVCWKGTEGYQLKSNVVYLCEGPVFENAKRWLAETLPHRILKGLIILRPYETFDVAPFVERAGNRVLIK